MAYKYKDSDGAVRYRRTLGAGTSGDPDDGTSLIQASAAVGSANPLHTQSATIEAAISGGLGATNETAPASDTATAAINGRLQRVAQNLTTLNSNLVAQAKGTLADPLYTRGKMRAYRLNPTLTTGGVGYVANDALGPLVELAGAVAGAGRGTFLHSIQVACVQAPSFLRLIFFDAEPTASTFTNDAAIVLAYADQEKIAAYFDIGAGVAVDGNTYTAGIASTSPTLPKAVMPLSGTSLYVALQTTGAVTFSGAGDIDVTIILYDE